jgi:hypothetical protein
VLTAYRLLVEPGQASDHHGLAVTIDTDEIDTSQPQECR